jgi:hypothetical protein
MFHQIFPVLMNAGVVSPTHVDLVVDRVYFAEAAVANEVMSLDMTLTQTATTSFNPAAVVADTAVPTNAFGTVVKPVVNTYTNALLQQTVGIFGVAEVAVAAAAFGKLRLIGVCAPTLTAAAGIKGSAFYPTLSTTGKLTMCAVPGGALSTGANLRKIVGISLATNGTSIFFNGFGFGFHVSDTLA